MSIHSTQTFTQAANINEFKFDSTTSFETIRERIYTGNDQNLVKKSSIYDRDNLKLLKKQLGMETQELILKELMTKNNALNDNVIASQLKQPDIADLRTNDIRSNNEWTATRIPYDIIFQKIKKVLPFLSNLFMELIEDKFPTGVSVQVSQYQNLQERLNQAQFTEKISSENKQVKKAKK